MGERRSETPFPVFCWQILIDLILPGLEGLGCDIADLKLVSFLLCGSRAEVDHGASKASFQQAKEGCEHEISLFASSAAVPIPREFTISTPPLSAWPPCLPQTERLSQTPAVLGR